MKKTLNFLTIMVAIAWYWVPTFWSMGIISNVLVLIIIGVLGTVVLVVNFFANNN